LLCGELAALVVDVAPCKHCMDPHANVCGGV
jgi:hypothetical protein